ncbi:pyridoxamine 5'-phosphate oxidase family protein [Microcoleus sp. FACHB-SPT15]|uniref:pyridoxamine 5'-phosphate oxidase family protein n=1 Tax=Microcoleus sp. FACHB-SPT15 TaxID=2692830 RepID=UPI0017859625|nr:pyridoxamine 5'-phosphate oxidase family protein [Microcoleus sp. FACHB-SPT15]MBD1804521.1 pyridoxamine 5'-phosphate oxidase family protein [Microcoleus sp. FACHB-SPT15]
MAKFYPDITAPLQDFIKDQKVFFTATAPRQGRINLSPKGIDTFRCIDNKTVAYLDLTGSGNETAAHLNEDSRMTIMFCSFSEKPLILRLYGQGKVIHPRNEDWQSFYSLFNPVPGERQIIFMQVDFAQTSCGTGVPIYEFKEERQAIIDWANNKGEQGLYEYWQAKNLKSIDGLPTKLLED